MTNNTDLAYAAGLIDGEGSILIIGRKRKKKDSRKRYTDYYLRVKIESTDGVMCPWMQMKFGGCLRFLPIKNVKYSDKYLWEMNSRSAANFLRQVLPYLKVKKQHAEIALEFQNTMLTSEELKAVRSEKFGYTTPVDVMELRAGLRNELMSITRVSNNDRR